MQVQALCNTKVFVNVLVLQAHSQRALALVRLEMKQDGLGRWNEAIYMHLALWEHASL